MKRTLAFVAAASLLAAGCATTPPPTAGATEETPVHVYGTEDVRMQLMGAQCADARSLKLAIAASPDYAGRWRAIRSSWRGQNGEWREFAGCWLELSAEEARAPGAVLVLIFEDGERYVVLKSEFLAKRKNGA